MLVFGASAQTIDWYELVIVPELEQAGFLVVRVDSVGKKCSNKRNLVYCSRTEEVHDNEVAKLRDKQLESLEGVWIKWKMISADSLEVEEFADKSKYRYIIDYDYDLLGLEKEKSSLVYLKLDFLLIDRVSGNIMGRSMQYDLNDPFEPMELLLDELLDMNSSN